MMEIQEVTPEEVGAEAAGPGGLSAKQELALRAVISHPTLKEAAAEAGVSETTLWRYMRDERFASRLREARREAVEHASVRLQRASGDAVAVLQSLMMKEDAPPSTRITAARTVLDYSYNVVGMDELKTRLNQLEDFIRMKQDEYALDAALREERESRR